MNNINSMHDMNAQEDQLHQVNISMQQAEDSVNLASALERLHNNKDFQAVILTGYFRDEASRLVLLRADPEMQDDRQQKEVNNMITSIGGLFGYFNKVFTMGTMSRRSIIEDEQTREDILREQLTDETVQ